MRDHWPDRRSPPFSARSIACAVLLALGLVLSAGGPAFANKKYDPFHPDDLEPVIKHLVGRGLEESRVRTVLLDPSLRRHSGVVGVNVRNPDREEMYAQFIKPYTIRQARRFAHKHRDLLIEAEGRHGVPRGIIIGILLVESRLGQHTNRYSVLEVFTSLAARRSPEMVNALYQQVKRKRPDATRDWLNERLEKKTGFAMRELEALFQMFPKENADMLKLRGSYAGAIGIPQFLPSSKLQWGVDGDKDGKVDLNNMRDAIHSVGHYLSQHGWTKDATFEEKWRSIWKYNHSNNYVRTIFEVAIRVTSPFKYNRPQKAAVVHKPAPVRSNLAVSTGD